MIDLASLRAHAASDDGLVGSLAEPLVKVIDLALRLMPRRKREKFQTFACYCKVCCALRELVTPPPTPATVPTGKAVPAIQGDE